MCASNETYLEELKRLVQTRLTIADQEGALKEVMLRNREEFLLKKKNANLVDEMQLGLINLEKSYTVMRELTRKMLDQTIEEQMIRRGKKTIGVESTRQAGRQINSTQNEEMEFDDAEFSFK